MIDPETGQRWTIAPLLLFNSPRMQLSKEFLAKVDRALRRCECLAEEGPPQVACRLEKGHSGKHRPPLTG